ncbi:Protein GVP36 [Grifola frondosa]|uniref:Protein GVP36 n=1 Tax=Grifola frondosa TaxID=5627 RepID=A0A1C7M8J4_GRIFR|nr:Protein GVP36 [Grifola frondosa]
MLWSSRTQPAAASSLRPSSSLFPSYTTLCNSHGRLEQTPNQLCGLNLGQSANKFAKGFSSSVQATKERLGQVSPEEITELPQEYKDLEARVDSLRQAHLALLKVTKVYETETYDYPTQIQESISELGTTIGHGITSFAAANLKGTNLPTPASPTPAAPQHKTLPHAIGRAATTAAVTMQTASGANDDKFGKALHAYASAWEKIADARVQQDAAIKAQFLQPWQTTLSTSIAVAMRARQAVRLSRLELDAAKQTLKTASAAKQEAARLEVENAEDDLVQKTEVAITLMKTVLENPEPIKNLNELAKAQLLYYSATAEALSVAQGETEELSVAAEGDYRKSRDH